MALEYSNYIGDQWKPSVTGQYEASLNPANRHEIVGYVQKSGIDDLVDAVSAAQKALPEGHRVGDGMDSNTWMGPCASIEQLSAVLSYIEENGLNAGLFAEPTVFEGVDSYMTIAKEEIFGPVLALMKVSSMGEAPWVKRWSWPTIRNTAYAPPSLRVTSKRYLLL